MPSTPSASQQKQTPPAGSKEYRYMGNHATEIPTGDTLPWLEPGEILTMTNEDAQGEKAARLIEEGRLVDTSTIGLEAGLQAEGQSASTDEETKGGK